MHALKHLHSACRPMANTCPISKRTTKQNHVYVKEIATGKVTRAIEEKDELIKGYGWISDEKLYYMMDKGGNENFHIYATNIDGTNARDLTPFEGVRAGIIRVLKDQKNVLIIQMNKTTNRYLNLTAWMLPPSEITPLFENKDAANSIQSYEFDKDGNLRAYTIIEKRCRNRVLLQGPQQQTSSNLWKRWTGTIASVS